MTDDGSTSLALLNVKEQYHSTFGAIQEAQFVYIKNGLIYKFNSLSKNNTLNVLEIGFGTGLNAFLTFLESQKHNININYVGIEAFPLEAEEVSQLNYVAQLEAQNHAHVFENFHRINPKTPTQITSHFKLTLNDNLLQKFEDSNQFDLIYFDAFGPDVQPELWAETIFYKMFAALKSQGVLVTYSAKGSVRRSMQSVGFRVERLPGPPGKREMLRATKP